MHTADIAFSQEAMVRGGVPTQPDLETGTHPVERFCDYLDGKSQPNYGACVNAMAAHDQTDTRAGGVAVCEATHAARLIAARLSPTLPARSYHLPAGHMLPPPIRGSPAGVAPQERLTPHRWEGVLNPNRSERVTLRDLVQRVIIG